MTIVAAVGVVFGASPGAVVLACAVDAAAAAGWHAWRGFRDRRDPNLDLLLAPLVYAAYGGFIAVRLARADGGLDLSFILGGIIALILMAVPIITDIVREVRQGRRPLYGWRDRIAVWIVGLGFLVANPWHQGAFGPRPTGAFVALVILTIGALADVVRLAGRHQLTVLPKGGSAGETRS
jgi:hypothetical protein